MRNRGRNNKHTVRPQPSAPLNPFLASKLDTLARLYPVVFAKESQPYPLLKKLTLEHAMTKRIDNMKNILEPTDPPQSERSIFLSHLSLLVYRAFRHPKKSPKKIFEIF